MNEREVAKEQEFMKTLQETLKQARRSGGVIRRSEIAERFGPLELEQAQLDQVEAYLKAHKITVGSDSTDGADDEDLPEEERDFLQSYKEMLEEIPVLSDSVLDAVKISAMAGEASAQKELTEQMLGKVVEIARLYAGQGVSAEDLILLLRLYMEDLIGAGNEALVTGVTLLGHLEGPQEVEGELGRRIMDSMEDLISAMLDEKAFDRELEDEVNLVADKAKELAEILGRKVTAEELAREGEVTLEQINNAVRMTGGMIGDLEEAGK